MIPTTQAVINANDYCHTGCGTVPDIRPEFYEETKRDIIDAPDFTPQGYHFVSNHQGKDIPCGAHTLRPRAFI